MKKKRENEKDEERKQNSRRREKTRRRIIHNFLKKNSSLRTLRPHTRMRPDEVEFDFFFYGFVFIVISLWIKHVSYTHFFQYLFTPFPSRSIHLWSVPTEKSGHFIYAYFILSLALNLPLTSSSCHAGVCFSSKKHSALKEAAVRTAAGSVCARKIFARKPRREDEREGGGKKRERENGPPSTCCVNTRYRTLQAAPISIFFFSNDFSLSSRTSSYHTAPSLSLSLLAFFSVSVAHVAALRETSASTCWVAVALTREKTITEKYRFTAHRERGWQLVFSESQIALYRLLRASDARVFFPQTLPISVLTNPYKSARK